jgi:3-oxoacyl-[acyl-carrier protein] reductase
MGGRAIAVKDNVADRNDMEGLFKLAVEIFGGIKVLINCAGRMPLSAIESYDLDLFASVIDTNLRGTFVVLEVAKHMLPR